MSEVSKLNAVDFEARAKQVLSQLPILTAKEVEVTFSLRGQKLTAIRRASLELYEGETLAIVGESGSGKSVFTKCFVGMLDKNGSITHGSIEYDGMDLTQLTLNTEILLEQNEELPDYPYLFSIWQYQSDGSLSGLKKDARMMISFVDYKQQ